MALDIVIFVFMLLVLVLAHEWGHFFAARKAGIKVEEFAFGFPPRLWSVIKNGTRYSFNVLPIGGYVKIFGEDESSNHQAGSFASKPARWRALVLAAGVLMNVFLGALIFAVGFSTTGLPAAVSDSEAQANHADIQIFQVNKQSPAAQAGLQIGDTITALDGRPIGSIDAVQKYIDSHKGASVAFTIARGGETFVKNVYVRENVPEGQGPTGIALGYTTLIRYPWYQAIWEGLKEAVKVIALIFIGLFEVIKQIFSSGAVPLAVTGPVGIARLSFQFESHGFAYILWFAGLLSINLAVINILPIPALDGGRLLFLGIEKILRRPVNQRIEQTIHMIGFALLILFVIFITGRDLHFY